MRAELRRGNAYDFLDERLALGIEHHLRREAVDADRALEEGGCDDVGQRMVGGLARDRIPRVLADLDEMVVGTFLGEYADLLYPGKILDTRTRLERRLYRALCDRADRPALHERFAHARERDARVQPLAQHRQRVVLHVYLLDESSEECSVGEDGMIWLKLDILV